MRESNSKKTNKKGIASIEIIIGVVIFMMVLFFASDIMKIGIQFSVISQTTTEVARLGAIQGGFADTKPANYPGSYVTISGLNNNIGRKFSSAGIDPSKYSIDIGSGHIGNKGVRSATYDYKREFEVKTTLDYNWVFMERVLGVNMSQKLVSKRLAMSEWKMNYNSWDGE